jgi:hypothetical protein
MAQNEVYVLHILVQTNFSALAINKKTVPHSAAIQKANLPNDPAVTSVGCCCTEEQPLRQVHVRTYGRGRLARELLFFIASADVGPSSLVIVVVAHYIFINNVCT